MDLKGSRTEANLMAAFAGEAQARDKYTYYASQAKKDGYEQIGIIFTETANNEKEHAEIWFKLLHNGMPNTEVNLQDAAAGEHFEWSEMYKGFAEEAKKEGFDQIAALFSKVAEIEKYHENRFLKLLSNVRNNEVFQKKDSVQWICSNCGHIHEGTEAPQICPVCSHSRSYFQLEAENY